MWLPRQFGHSTAALDILGEYPSSIIITQQIDRHSSTNGVITLSEFRNSSQDLNLLQTLSTLKNGLDFVIADDVRLKEEEIDKIFQLFSPKLLVLLGGISC